MKVLIVLPGVMESPHHPLLEIKPSKTLYANTRIIWTMGSDKALLTPLPPYFTPVPLKDMSFTLPSSW